MQDFVSLALSEETKKKIYLSRALIECGYISAFNVTMNENDETFNTHHSLGGVKLCISSEGAFTNIGGEKTVDVFPVPEICIGAPDEEMKEKITEVISAIKKI